jgi:hypothetical protein
MDMPQLGKDIFYHKSSVKTEFFRIMATGLMFGTGIMQAEDSRFSN